MARSGSPACERPIERGGVAPERLLGHADLLVAPAGEDLGPERAAQEMERAAEGGAGVSLVEIGPEEGEERVAPVEPAGRVGGEVGEEAEPLRLLEHGPHLPAFRGPEVQHAESVQLDHGGREMDRRRGEAACGGRGT